MSAQIPSGKKTVSVSVISPNRVLGVPASAFLEPEIKGTAYNDTPCLAFLIEHQDDAGNATRLLFDLGIRKDWENSPPRVVEAVRNMNIEINTEKDTADLLVEKGHDLSSIDAVIFSHWHFDHTGDMNLFPDHVKVVVGPGFISQMLPGYPIDQSSMIDDAAFGRHEIKELIFDSHIEIVGLNAIDWFHDGSFYILDTPGHAVGHISALARTTKGEDPTDDTFIFLAGDVCHHAGELRPSVTLDLPPDHLKYLAAHPSKCKTAPFYTASPGGFNMDVGEMRRTVEKVQELDGNPNVFTVLAHDNWLLRFIKLFPSNINDWKSENLAERSKWAFLEDFLLIPNE